MNGNEKIGPTILPEIDQRIIRTDFIIHTEIGKMDELLKFYMTREDFHNVATLAMIASEMGDAIFQIEKLAKELNLKVDFKSLFEMGKRKYEEKMKEYREKGREWL
jgi:hypothetical protein